MIVTNPSSPLVDLVRCVVAILAALPSQQALPPEQRITVTIGERPKSYEGAPPRVHFWPDPRGTWGDPPAGAAGKGYVGGIAHGCTVFVWGAPGDDDFAMYDPANVLLRQVTNAIKRAGTGRVAGASFGNDAKADEALYGKAYVFRFVYAYGIQRDAEVWALPSDPPGGVAVPPDPNAPPGTPASTVAPLSTTVTLQPT